MSSPEQPSPPPATCFASDGHSESDHILLNVLSPSPEVPNGGRINFEKISLDTSISQLKARIRAELPTHPGPERQRLIYGGHALLNSDATLRQIFRPLQRSNEQSPAYTLHLVLPPQATAGTPPPQPPLPVHNHHQGASHPPRAASTIPAPHNPQVAVPNFHDALAHAQQAQQIMQQQLNMMQQQMHGQHNPHGQPPQHQPRGAVQMTYQIHGGQMPLPFPPGFTPAAHNMPNLQAVLGQQQALRAQAAMQGPHLVNQMGNNGTIPPHQARPTSSPSGIGDQAPSDATTDAGPNISSSTGSHPQEPQPSQLPTATTTGHQRHLPHPFNVHQRLRPAMQSSQPTTAWLLSSPTGPEALLFAPGHGYFASPSRVSPSTTSRVQSNVGVSSETMPAQQNTASNDSPAADRPAPARVENPPAGQMALANQGPGGNQNQIQNNENDLVHFILQRGWLFIRLYMFILVFSDGNTWRRWILLALATLVCCLPRENPFQAALVTVRRHVDNLIGPPAEQQQARPQGQAGHPDRPTPTNTAQAGQANPATQRIPETTATQQRQQQPNLVRDTLFRVERAVALFLASLVPGVGERHVQAREEARQRAEAERAREANNATPGEQERREGGGGQQVAT